MEIKKDILATLTYFNMFAYPLRKREIYIFLGCAAGSQKFEEALNLLVHESAVFKIGDFYSLHNNYALAERRIKGNEKAAVMMQKAEKSAAIISSFPFVKGVAVSGSLSKNFADENADIDFFIITANNRLWIARSYLHLFKKFTFLFKRQHEFCMNYFVDESASCIPEKNIYTATEVATVLPMRGNVFEKFYADNGWTKKFLPNNYMHVSTAKKLNHNLFALFQEKMLSNKLGDLLDTFLMKLTVKSWSLKTKRQKKDSKGMPLSLHANKHFAKPDPTNFQQKVLQRYNLGIADILSRYEQAYQFRNELL